MHMDMHEYVMKIHIYGLEMLKMMLSKVSRLPSFVFLENQYMVVVLVFYSHGYQPCY